MFKKTWGMYTIALMLCGTLFAVASSCYAQEHDPPSSYPLTPIGFISSVQNTASTEIASLTQKAAALFPSQPAIVSRVQSGLHGAMAPLAAMASGVRSTLSHTSALSSSALSVAHQVITAPVAAFTEDALSTVSALSSIPSTFTDRVSAVSSFLSSLPAQTAGHLSSVSSLPAATLSSFSSLTDQWSERASSFSATLTDHLSDVSSVLSSLPSRAAGHLSSVSSLPAATLSSLSDSFFSLFKNKPEPPPIVAPPPSMLRSRASLPAPEVRGPDRTVGTSFSALESRVSALEARPSVIERIVEKVSTFPQQAPAPRSPESTGSAAPSVSPEELSLRLSALNNELRKEIYAVGSAAPTAPSLAPLERMISLTQKIDTLKDLTITDATISGASTFTGESISVSGALSAGSMTATSLTLTGGIVTTGGSTLNGILTVSSFAATSTTATSTIATGGFTVGTNHFVVQQTSGNVGVGTTSPSARFAFTGDGTGATRAFVIADSANTERVSILNNGNVGLGTTSPGSLLSVQGDALISGNISVGSITGLPSLTIAATTTATSFAASLLGTVGAPAFTFSNDLNTGLWSSTADTLNFSTAGSERVRIDSSGNVGLGTTTPWGLLSVEMGTADNAFVVSDQGTSTPSFVVKGSGNVGLGTTSPVQLLSVSGTSALAGAVSVGAGYGGTAPPSNGMIIQGNVGLGTTTPGALFAVHGAGLISSNLTVGGTLTATSTVLLATTAGNVGIGTTSPTRLLSVHGDTLVSGTSFFGGAITATSTLSALSLSITSSAATSTFSGNLSAANILAGVTLSAPFFTATTTATSTFVGGVTAGGLATSAGLTITGGGILSSATATSSFTGNGINVTAGCVAINGVCAALGGTTINAGTANRLAYYSGATTVGSSAIAIDNSVQRIGIGSTTPGATLSVTGPGVFTDTLTFTSFVATSTTATSTIAGGLAIETSGLVYDWQTNNVGVGTSSPGSLLALQGSANFGVASSTVFSALIVPTLTATSSLTVSATDAASSTINTLLTLEHLASDTGGLNGIGGALLFKAEDTGGSGTSTARILAAFSNVSTSTPASYLAFETKGITGSLSERLRIDSTGNVGLGTTSPGSIFSVQGVGNFASGNSYLYPILNLPSFVATSTSATSTIAGGLAIETSGLVYDWQTNSVGIGTSSPSQILSVQGNSYVSGTSFFGGAITGTSTLAIQSTTATSTFSTGGLTVGTSHFVVQQTSGNVGIGTTTPAQLLSIAGHCVTGDTRLRRRRRRKNANGEWEYEYDEVEIKDVKEGDEIASLDEHTGRVVYRRVNGLLDMGVKTTYRLRTEDGREIRTTATHPYYAKNSPAISQAVVRAGVFIDNANLYKASRLSGWRVDFERLKGLFNAAFDVRTFNLYAALPAKNDPARREMDDFLARMEGAGIATKVKDLKYIRAGSEIVRKGDTDIELTRDIIEAIDELDVIIVVSGDSDFVPLREYARERNKQILFVAYKKNIAWELRLGKFLVLEKIRQFIDFGATKTPEFDLGVTIMRSIIANRALVSRGTWTKVAELKAGMEIGVPDAQGILAWKKIASIEKVGEEQVYDIEVEGTHNFLGNDIFAHNTYLTGGLGAGITEATNGNITGTGRLSITSTTATSTFSTGGLTVGTSQFVVQQTSGNVGIGTTSPSEKLTVYGAVIRLEGAGLTPFAIANNNSTGFRIYDYTAGLDRVTINTSGNVGIGTTTPTSILNIANTGTAQFTISDTDAGVNAKHWYLQSTGGALNIGTTSDALSVGTAYVTVANGGNVGIGTTGPGARLHVEGTNNLLELKTTGDASGVGATYQEFYDVNGRIGYFGFPGAGSYGMDIWNDKAGYVQVGTNNLVRVRIQSDGNVGIGTTSPWRVLAVTGTVGFSSTLSTESGSDNYLCIDPLTFEVTDGGATCGASSRRFKENIIPITYGLSDILKLNPVSFTYRKEITPDASKQLGFIAEEIYDVLPELVELDKDNLPESVDYAKMTAVLVKAVQEMNMKIEDTAAQTSVAELLSQGGAQGFADAGTLVREAVAGIAGIADVGLKRLTGAIYSAVGMFDTLIADRIVVTRADIEEARIERLKTQELCVGVVCVSEDDFLRVFGTGTGDSVGEINPVPDAPVPSAADTEAPTITILGNNPARISLGATYSDMGATVSDNSSTNLGYSLIINDVALPVGILEFSLDTSTTTTHTIVYTASDAAGNSASSTRTVIVEE